MTNAYISGTPVPMSDVPPAIGPRVKIDAPAAAKMLLARAVIPMSPDDMGLALAILVRDPDAEIASTATTSLKEMPPTVIENLMSNATLAGSVLDVFAHVFSDDWRLLQRLVANRSAEDDTVRWMARKLKGNILDVIASNQVRVVRQPDIIVALVKNPATPTPLLARVLETAIRNDVNTTRIPGFKQLAEAFFGDTSAMRGDARLQKQSSEPEPLVSEEEESTSDPLTPPLETTPTTEEADHELRTLLTAGDKEADEDADGEKDDQPEEKEFVRGKPLFKLIEEMNVPQKVRLALMGDSSARKILVRDKVRIVSDAVMKSPKVTEKEISNFVLDKAISGDIIRTISKNREYTRNYQIMLALIYNPKTPPPQATSFIRNLRRRDLQNLLRAKGVPAYINRVARQIRDKREGA